MNKIFYLLLLSLLILKNPLISQTIGYDKDDSTQDFYDNSESFSLITNEILVEGEITNPSKIDFSKFNKRSVIVKEAHYSKQGNKFIGAYNYEGYSLYDLLNHYIISKTNFNEFNLITDLFIEISNDSGEKVYVSWGEIYYPSNQHRIIVATDVRRITPSKTKEMWELPKKSKLIIANDLASVRNIESPSKIRIRSFPKKYPTIKGKKPNFSPKIRININGETTVSISELPKNLTQYEYPVTFYGRGRGLHSTEPFKGVLLKDILSPLLEINETLLKKTLVTVVANDGYRAVFGLSELINRNDQSEIMLIYNPDKTDDGPFRIFVSGDFFSDRAVKGIEIIEILSNL